MQDSTFWYVCQYAHCDLMVSKVTVVNTGGENKDCAGEAMVLPPCKQEIRNTINANTIIQIENAIDTEQENKDCTGKAIVLPPCKQGIWNTSNRCRRES